MHSSIKGAYWDTLYKIAHKAGNKDVIQIMNDVEKAVDDEVLKQIKEGKLDFKTKSS